MAKARSEDSLKINLEKTKERMKKLRAKRKLTGKAVEAKKRKDRVESLSIANEKLKKQLEDARKEVGRQSTLIKNLNERNDKAYNDVNLMGKLYTLVSVLAEAFPYAMVAIKYEQADKDHDPVEKALRAFCRHQARFDIENRIGRVASVLDGKGSDQAIRIEPRTAAKKRRRKTKRTTAALLTEASPTGSA